MADELLVAALDRNGIDLSYLRQRRGHMMLDVAHERSDGGQTQIASGGAISPLLLDVPQKVDDERRVELFDREPGRPCRRPRRGVLQE